MIKALSAALLLAVASAWTLAAPSQAANWRVPALSAESDVILVHRKKCKKGYAYSKKAKRCVAKKAKKVAKKVSTKKK